MNSQLRFKKAIMILLFFGLALVTVLLSPSLFDLHITEAYQAFHMILETIPIIIAMQIAGLGWNTYRHRYSTKILFLSLIFLGVGIFDFTHMLSYQGMPYFLTPNTPDKTIYFWLAARLFSTIGILIYVLYSFHSVMTQTYRILLTIAILTLIGVMHWPLVHPESINYIFFTSEYGLTSLKISIEYFIILMNLMTGLILYKQMKEADSSYIGTLFIAVGLMAMSEFFFTLYSNLTDIYNVMGHIYKAIAYLFIYRAIFVTSVQDPYKDLEESKSQLDKKNQWLSSILDNIPHMVFVKNASDLRFALFNKAGEKLLGSSKEELIGRNDYDLFPKEQADYFIKKDTETLQKQTSIDIAKEEIETPAGKRILHTTKIILKDEDGKPNYLLGISEDITERELASSKLLKLSLAVEQSPNSVIITDLDGNIEYANKMFTTVTGYSLDEVIGTNPRVLKSGNTPQETYDEMWECLTRGEIWRGELINLRKDKSPYIELATISPVKQPDGTTTNYVAIKVDITAKKRDEAQMENLAHFDQLTGLPNRVMLYDRIKYLLNMAQRNNESMSVMFLDLDHFKNINDSLGHSIGDKLLIEIAKRIKMAIRDEDTVSRLGGDEFIMLFPDTDANTAMHIATKLISVISQPLIIQEHELIITPSIGIAIYPDDGDNFETLLKNADTAMYKVKNDSRNNFNFFTQEMQLHSSRNLLLANALHYALERNELEVYYQPQISIEDGHVIGAEALLRWKHPDLGMISPAEFIPIAEDSGQIIAIGEWVLRTAINQVKICVDKGFDPFIMAVNLSAVQFRQPNLIGVVNKILEEVQLPQEYLELELTEAATMSEPQSAIDIMNTFYDQGIRMAIDDFGTGYSSLSYLKQFKVYKLKIDQSFICNIENDSDDRAIVSAIIDMANNLGLRTIAEGVETSEQLAFLRLHGCNEVQGYYFSKPLPAQKFLEFLHKNSK